MIKFLKWLVVFSFRQKFQFIPLLMAMTSVSFASIQQEIKAIEQQSGGRIGISAHDTGTGYLIEYRSQERFPFCSTFKVMGVAAILNLSEKNNALLTRRIDYHKDDLVTYSPITEKHLDEGMTVAELCEATLTTSDNTAINLLMRMIEGPKAVTKFARTIGDTAFLLTDWEPNLNTAIPGEKQNTTTPEAMRKSLEELLLGSVLDIQLKVLLKNWLIGNTTGDRRIRAGVPNQWKVGDKTGTGDYGTTNDIGVIYPPQCKPIILAIYFTQTEKNALANESVIASLTKKIVSEFRRKNPCLQK